LCFELQVKKEYIWLGEKKACGDENIESMVLGGKWGVK